MLVASDWKIEIVVVVVVEVDLRLLVMVADAKTSVVELMMTAWNLLYLTYWHL
jgi:hypothetical protein